jgi:hypothetical protein
VRFHMVVVDCADPRSLATFWEGFTGFERRTDHEDWVSIHAHLDFAATDEEATAREIEGMGATRRWVSEDPEDPFVVLADPEGNEFCIVRAD